MRSLFRARPLHAVPLPGGKLSLVFQLLTVAMLCCVMEPASSKAGDDFDFPDTNYTVRSIDGVHIIGDAHFAITEAGGGLKTVRGEYRFFDGEYDIDDSTLRPGVGARLPTLVRTRHTFFLSGGTLDRESHVDVAAGTGECTIYTNGKPQVSGAKFRFPSDTFAGDAVVLPLRRFVESGANGSTSFHAFNCIPGPKLLKVTVTARPPAAWDYYPGNLVQVDVKPDFGWINVVIAPFLPEIRAWFDPSEGTFFVGCETARYYKGLKYLMVRSRSANEQIKAAH
jgi:hypothetical protein